MGDTQNLINSSLNLDQFPLEESILIPESGFADQDRENNEEETDEEMSTGEILLRRYSQDESVDMVSQSTSMDAVYREDYSEIDTDDLLDRIQSRQRLERNQQAATGSNTDELVERILTRNETNSTSVPLPNTPDIEELLDYPSNENA